MAEKRMMSKKVIDSDLFLEMPVTAQLLYMHLMVRADDDGFVGKPKGIMRMIGAKDDDMCILLSKRFIIAFDDGIVVIRHWRIHNTIQKDRYTPTQYVDDMKKLVLNPDKSYDVSNMDTKCIQNGNTDIDIGLDIDIDKNNNILGDKPTVKRFVKPTVEDIESYCRERGNNIDAQYFYDYYESKGWKVGSSSSMKDWKACVRTWERNNNNTGRKKREVELPSYYTSNAQEKEVTMSDEQMAELLAMQKRLNNA